MRSLPVKSVIAWGFTLNMMWEFLQCTVLYDMWAYGYLRASLYMWGAIMGDVLIVIGVVYLTVRAVGAEHVVRMDKTAWLGLLTFGLTAAVLLEWFARALNLWSYTDLMPTITLGDSTIGLSPVVQVALLPALAVWLAVRNNGTHRDTTESNQSRRADTKVENQS